MENGINIESRLQITRQAAERSAEKRSAFCLDIALHYSPEQLVFVDESSCDLRTTYRANGWSLSGTRATRSSFFFRGIR